MMMTKLTSLINTRFATFALMALFVASIFALPQQAEAQNSATVTSRAMQQASSLNLAALQALISNVRQVSAAQEPLINQLNSDIAAYRAGPKATLNSSVASTQAILTEAEEDIGGDPSAPGGSDERKGAEGILAEVKPQARPVPSSCAAGEVLSWDTDAGTDGAWLCTQETDPNAGPHAAVGLTPPVCPSGNGTSGNPGGKLIWNGTQWRCLTDSAINTGLIGPQGPAGEAGPAGETGSSIWTQTGAHIYYSANYVGIGTAAPSYWLHVVGNSTVTGNIKVGQSIKLGNSSTCNATYRGALRYNTSTDEFLICQSNNTWGVVDLGGMGDCGTSDCALPWGGLLADGQSVTAYLSSSVPYGGSCSSQTRSCSSGTLTGSYTHQSCSSLPPSNCGTPWGGFVAHGGNVLAYQAASVPYGNSCTSQTRSCTNGALSGSYQYETCTPESAPSTCALPWGGSLAHNASVTAYQNSSVPYGSSCTSQTRTCTDGALSGSYAHANCNVASASPCALPWGGSISHGNTVTAYAASSVGCGSSCSSQTRSCNNGSLTGSYSYQNCSVASCNNCVLDGVTINHGSNRTFYTAASVPCGSSCSGGTRSCNNGSLGGSSSYNRANCSVAGCSNCTLDGATVSHGASRAFYLSSRACGQACTAIDQTRSCNNGTLNGSSSYNKRNCPAENCVCSPSSATSVSNLSSGGTMFGAANAAACKLFCENEKASFCMYASAYGYCYAYYSGSTTLDTSSATYDSKWSCPGGTNNTKKCSYYGYDSGSATWNYEAVAHGATRNPVCGICTTTPGGTQTCSNATWSGMTQYTPGWSSCTGCKVICTELYNQGLLSEEVYKADQLYGRTISSPAAMKVYSLWGVPTAQLMAKSPLVTAIVRPLATAWAEHMAYEMGVTEDDNLLGRVLRMTFLPLHEALGAVFYPELNETPSADKPGMPSESIPVATLPGLKK